jgi:hypothetical protein
MTAPGESLEFQASALFRARTASSPELLEHIKELIKHDPNIGEKLCPGISTLTFELRGLDLVLFWGRRGNRISLMYVHPATETKLIEERKKELLRLQGKEV